jgi:hypothetical protein
MTKGSKTKTAKINADAFWSADDWQEWNKSHIGNNEQTAAAICTRDSGHNSRNQVLWNNQHDAR